MWPITEDLQYMLHVFPLSLQTHSGPSGLLWASGEPPHKSGRREVKEIWTFLPWAPSLWDHCGLAATLNKVSSRCFPFPLSSFPSLSLSLFSLHLENRSLPSFDFQAKEWKLPFPLAQGHCTLFLLAFYTLLALCKWFLQTGVCHLHT